MYIQKVKGQTFNIGKTINFTKCDCVECDFMNCPKNNYCHEYENSYISVKDFFNDNFELITNCNTLGEKQKYFNILEKCVAIPYSLFCDFIENCIKFPKNLFWNIGATITNGESDDFIVSSITICSLSGVSYVEIYSDGDLVELPKMQKKAKGLANSISKALIELNVLFKTEKDKFPKYAWLSEEGVVHRCSSHLESAERILKKVYDYSVKDSDDYDYAEDMLISKGFVKLSDSLFSVYCKDSHYRNVNNHQFDYMEKWCKSHKLNIELIYKEVK